MGRVRRWLARGSEPLVIERDGPACQGCGSPLPSTHRHVVDVASRGFLCVCASCYVTLPSAVDSKHRAIPERCVRLQLDPLDDVEWDTLQIPVGIAFFFVNSSTSAVVACYPSPAGPVESQLPLGDAPWARKLAPDVEALMVRRTHRARDSFIVPIDVAYELVGRVRAGWSGLGARAESEIIDSFFQRLESQTGVPG